MIIALVGQSGHGKSALFHALSGAPNPDKGASTDLSFTTVDLRGYGRVCFVDTPGDHLTPLIAGLMGADTALLCVAADAGIQEQTRLHFEALKLLPMTKIVVAITKVDICSREQIAECRTQVKKLLLGTKFQSSPIVEVNLLNEANLLGIKKACVEALNAVPPKEETTGWYMPIDRAFEVKGQGVVASGNLSLGTLTRGEPAVILPEGLRVKIRTLKINGADAESARYGTRVVLGLLGPSIHEVKKGQTLGTIGIVHASHRIQVQCNWVGAVKDGLRVRVYIGGQEVFGRLYLGEEDQSQAMIKLEHKAAVAKNQQILIRDFDKPEFLGGGYITIPVATTPRVAAVISSKNWSDAIQSLCASNSGGIETEEICRQLGVSAPNVGDTFAELKEANKITGFAGLWFNPAHFLKSTQRFMATLGEMHREAPGVVGFDPATVVLNAELPWEGKALDRILTELETQGLVRNRGGLVFDTAFRIVLKPRQQELLNRVVAILTEASPSVPDVKELARNLNVPLQAIQEIIELGIQAGQVVALPEGLYYAQTSIAAMQTVLTKKWAKRQFTSAEARDALGTTRKYAIPILEYFDSVGVTVRRDENRTLA